MVGISYFNRELRKWEEHPKDNSVVHFTIVLLNWNRGYETIRCIRSIEDQSFHNFELLIIDNYSDEVIVDQIDHAVRPNSSVRLKFNYGCPGGRNFASKYANGEYLFFVDNDGLLHRDALLLAYQSTLNLRVDVLAGFVQDFEDETDINLSAEIGAVRLENARSFQGGVCVIKKEIFHSIMYRSDFVYGNEEEYFSIECHKRGIRVYQNKGIVLWHKKSMIERNEIFERKQTIMNRYLTYRVFMPFHLWLIYRIYFLHMYVLRPFFYLKKGIGIADLTQLKSRFSDYARDPLSSKDWRNYKGLN